MKYTFIASEEGNYPINSMCRWSGVSRSGYHSWKTTPPSARARRRAELVALVRWCFDRSEGTYGYRRVHAELTRRGVQVDDDTVRQIMRAEGLVPCQPKPWRPVTTVADGGDGPADLVGRDFTADEPGKKLVGDITYIPTWEGFVYLATVLDCFSKKVIGYAMADHMRTELVCDAIDMAHRNGAVRRGTIFHSDRGSQYTSAQFAEHVARYGVLRSMGRTGVCWDNAWAESFNGTLKNERCNRTQYPTRRHAILDITRYIELWYNHQRLHSALGYQTPNEVEDQWWETGQAA